MKSFKNTFVLISLLVLVTIFLSACAHKINLENKTVNQKMTIADTLFQQENYNKAKSIYEIITFEGKGDTLIKRAQFQLANSYFELELYEDAIYEYKEFVRLFPLSKYSEKADFRIGLCYYRTSYAPEYDQERTKMAVNKLQEFKFNYTNSKKIVKANKIINTCLNELLEKKYQNAFIYYKLSDYNASLMYLTEIIENPAVNEKILKNL